MWNGVSPVSKKNFYIRKPMKLKYSEFEIPENEPYKNDLLNRGEFGENLTKIVSQITNPLTISVNGSWGTGKTVFLKMWNQSLKDAGYSTVYFSAWEDDYCDDALLALIGQIWKNIKDNDWEEMGKTFKEVATSLLKNISSQFLVNAIRICTANTVELDIEALKSHLESNVEKMLDEYVAATSGIKSVKEKLKEFSEKHQKKTGNPLVIIIDELDRCRPLFAIELLEKIKHFFEIPHIIFVFGIDREQLEHSIRSVYGNIDADEYLRRFIDLEFLLKMSDREPFFKSIFEKYGFVNHLVVPAVNSNWSATVSKCFSLSLREMEYLARTLVVGSIIVPGAGRYILPLLIALKMRDEIFYKRIIGGECNATEIIDRLTKTHNAWELFGIDPATKRYVRGHGHALCAELYAISPRSWRDGVIEALRESNGKPSQLSETLFHAAVQEVFYMTQDGTRHFDTNFDLAIHQGIPINDISKCIELVGFKDEA